MNEKQLLRKLQLLQSVGPDNTTLRVLQNRASAKLFPKKRISFGEWLINFPLPLVGAFALLILLFLAITGFLPQIFEQVQIAFAANQYEKAKIAYTYANEQFFKREDFANQYRLNSLSYSIALANIEMAGLKLKGEAGKYTSQQCLTLYVAYHVTLEHMKKTITGQVNTNESFSSLLIQVKQYDDQSEKKIHKYNE